MRTGQKAQREEFWKIFLAYYLNFRGAGVWYCYRLAVAKYTGKVENMPSLTAAYRKVRSLEPNMVKLARGVK